MGPLRTVHAFANRTADSNRIKLPPFASFKIICIDKITGVVHLAAKCNGELRRVFPGR